MSHTLGVMCGVCRAILESDEHCPECSGRHGYSHQQPSEWAAKTWPDHGCFAQPDA